MKKFILFICIVLFYSGQLAYAQVDSVGFQVNTEKIPSQIIYCSSYYFSNSDTVFFSVDDTSDFVFTWTFDKGEINELILNDTLPIINHRFVKFGEHTILFEEEEISTGKDFSKEKIELFQDELEIPNVFTPNGDGINDLFIIKASGIVEYDISIFGRTGILVFHQTAPILTWDGRNGSGNEVSSGTYYYILTALDNSIKPRKGAIQIYR
ncbi:MAG: gliding motility-associated C-terminal domain-containing protein [Bacteroidales bacterium]|jgi:gliding motility-associated-like protein|nr:gliding motility-associated C-terminal domain-containing protein [Bacteroidales bacterium]